MTRILFTVVACLVLLGGIAARQIERKQTGQGDGELAPEVLSLEKQEEMGELDVDDDVDIAQSITTTTTNTPTPTTPTQSIFNLTRLVYPDSHISSQSGTALSLTSGDSTDAITQWYQDRINESGINVRSFVKTKTNGSVLNKLVGATGGGNEITVEISKEANSNTTKVLVTVTK